MDVWWVHVLWWWSYHHGRASDALPAGNTMAAIDGRKEGGTMVMNSRHNTDGLVITWSSRGHLTTVLTWSSRSTSLWSFVGKSIFFFTGNTDALPKAIWVYSSSSASTIIDPGICKEKCIFFCWTPTLRTTGNFGPLSTALDRNFWWLLFCAGYG